jgi:MYXO-CTERM domain-containing protein
MFHATGTRVTAAAAEPLSMTLVGAAMFAAGWVRRRR